MLLSVITEILTWQCVSQPGLCRISCRAVAAVLVRPVVVHIIASSVKHS
jgi:hypothetical protein